MAAITRSDYLQFTVSHGATPNVGTLVQFPPGTDRVWVAAVGGDTRYKSAADGQGEGLDIGADYAVIPSGAGGWVDLNGDHKWGGSPRMLVACGSASGSTHFDPHRRHNGGGR